MRYIDADKFERACMFDKNCNDMQDMIYKLRDYPTADVRENVKGEWIERKPVHFGKVIKGLGSVFVCSVCGEEVDCKPYNFCPNCGADMRGKS